MANVSYWVSSGIVPIPGRDVFAQAWFQGGHTLVDFTDSSNPKEIAFFDRGPIHPTALVLGGLWSTYYYNGRTFGSEIARGFDVFRYTPTADLSANEIAAAEAVRLGFLSPHCCRESSTRRVSHWSGRIWTNSSAPTPLTTSCSTR